ncbi:hypothetical protein B0I29_11326 [Actinoplanes lutulentus]|uniref:PPE family protein n=1 Tax=Actinoplanes lutulentus TaxID=1287878 RepID=A0A327Z8V5_9ACTN|nr:hypothetical protein B0I29_11326 [Actinoplanes lutulentus]
MIAATGGGGGTNWAALRVDQMWAMLASHDEATHARLAGGWRRSSELVQEHIGQVRRYRESLADAWPPSRSPAAAAYFTRLDALITNLEETYEAAVANQRAFGGASGALRSARREMAAIAREHAANDLLLAGFAEEKRLHQLVGGKSRGAAPQRPVSVGRQAVLEARARAVMQSLSAELAQAQTALVVPSPYKPAAASPLPVRPPGLLDAGRQQAGVRPSAGQGEGAGSGGPSGAASGTDAGSGTRAGTRPGAGPGAGPGDRAGGVGAGPGLRPDRTAGGPVIGPVPAGRSPGSRRNGVIEPNRAAGKTPRPSEDLRQPRPVGGVIGGSAATGQHADQRPLTRVNPVGGLIGQPQARPPQQARPTRRKPTEEPWETKQGVDPVISPAPEQPIDPGPAIGHTPRRT